MTNAEDGPVIDDDDELLRVGVVRAPIPPTLLDCEYWAKELSQVTPLIAAGEGDGDYAFYRNILEEPDFPFGSLMQHFRALLAHHFGVKSENDIRLDDAFCVHYNMQQNDTTGQKHVDPSDITINLCLLAKNVKGSVVQFHGTEALESQQQSTAEQNSISTTPSPLYDTFSVVQKPGFATLHWGHHPHETTELQNGERTNIILTFCFADDARSTVANRTCYFPTT